MFNLSLTQIEATESYCVTGGRYIEKYKDEYVFFYSNLLTGQNILSASPTNMRNIRNNFDVKQLSKLNAESIRSENPFAQMELAFCDIDFCLMQSTDLVVQHAQNFDIRTITEKEHAAVEEFLSHISEDDRDTLDLSLEKDFAIGLYDESGSIVGMARYALIRNTENLVDVSIVITENARRKGYAIAIMTVLTQNISSKNLRFKYRVKEDNVPSIEIAKRLGLTPVFRLLAFKP